MTGASGGREFRSKEGPPGRSRGPLRLCVTSIVPRYSVISNTSTSPEEGTAAQRTTRTMAAGPALAGGSRPARTAQGTSARLSCRK
jgi:hypothetical protein